MDSMIISAVGVEVVFSLSHASHAEGMDTSSTIALMIHVVALMLRMKSAVIAMEKALLQSAYPRRNGVKPTHFPDVRQLSEAL